jgi:NTP pyrophosphatase (non-canonical NTP hydrolase)
LERGKKSFKIEDMDFKEYQKKSRKTAVYPQAGKNYIYPTLGLAGESGEVAEKIKKIIRDKKGKISRKTRAEVEKELGDVLWYISQLASELKLDMDNVAEKNIEKLYNRMKRGKLKGNGDNR